MKTILSIFLVLILILPSCKQEQTSTPDSEQMVMATLWFQHAAEMKALYHQAFNLARERVSDALDTLAPDLKNAVVVDIDETILNNSPSEAKNIIEGQRFSTERWMNWTSNASAEGLPGSLEFANYLLDKQVDLFYISNRDVEELGPTLDNLRKLKYPFADSTHVLLKTDTSDKTARRNTVQENYHIILFMGDNLGDFDHVFDNRENQAYPAVEALKNEFGKRFIVLPNPMYGAWTNGLLGSTSNMSPKELANHRKKYLKTE